MGTNNPSLVGLMEFLYQFANDERFNGVDILSISSLEVLQEMPQNETITHLLTGTRILLNYFQ